MLIIMEIYLIQFLLVTVHLKVDYIKRVLDLVKYDEHKWVVWILDLLTLNLANRPLHNSDFTCIKQRFNEF